MEFKNRKKVAFKVGYGVGKLFRKTQLFEMSGISRDEKLFFVCMWAKCFYAHQ